MQAYCLIAWLFGGHDCSIDLFYGRFNPLFFAESLKKYMNPIDLIEKCINEHGSASILRDNVALLRDQISVGQAKASVLEEENAILKVENIQLKADNLKLKSENQDLRQQVEVAQAGEQTRKQAWPKPGLIHDLDVKRRGI
jgi:hypothetical protein